MFSTRTHTDELIEIIESNTPAPTAIIKSLYDSFDTSKMEAGKQYYLNRNDILKRQIHTFIDGIKKVDLEAVNERIPAGFHKILVDQKTAYLAGEPMSFSSRSDNKKSLELLEELIGEKWEDTLPELIKNASNKGLEWLHPFINEAGEFDYVVVPAENFIPVYDLKKNKTFTAGIRFYSVGDDIVKLEAWTDTDVTYYEMLNGEVYLDAEEEVNPAPHYTDTTNTKWGTWGRVPFIEFANNNERIGDLFFYKEAIDAYDLLVSDAQTTLSDMQSLIWALKGYTGEDLGEFMTNLKRYKAVSLDIEGGIETIRAEVPVEAYQVQTEKLKEAIFAFGQGVNPSPDIIGSAPSGVALTNLYSLLDMKASMLERKFTLALREFMWFIEQYCTIANKGEFDYRDVRFSFNKMLLTNEAEIITMCKDSEGVISKTTQLENHPWVKDVALEQERLEKEAAANPAPVIAPIE